MTELSRNEEKRPQGPAGCFTRVQAWFDMAWLGDLSRFLRSIKEAIKGRVIVLGVATGAVLRTGEQPTHKDYLSIMIWVSDFKWRAHFLPARAEARHVLERAASTPLMQTSLGTSVHVARSPMDSVDKLERQSIFHGVGTVCFLLQRAFITYMHYYAHAYHYGSTKERKAKDIIITAFQDMKGWPFIFLWNLKTAIDARARTREARSEPGVSWRNSNNISPSVALVLFFAFFTLYHLIRLALFCNCR